MATSNCLETNILQNIFSVQQKKENQVSKLLEGELMMTELKILGELSLWGAGEEIYQKILNFKGVIWCNFKFSFLFGVLQADCA